MIDDDQTGFPAKETYSIGCPCRSFPVVCSSGVILWSHDIFSPANCLKNIFGKRVDAASPDHLSSTQDRLLGESSPSFTP